VSAKQSPNPRSPRHAKGHSDDKSNSDPVPVPEDVKLDGEGDAGDPSPGAGEAPLPQQPSTSSASGGEENAAADGWGSWFTKSFESAKFKSNEMFEYLKQDISEFGESIQEAGRDLKDKLKLEDTAKAAAETVGEKVNSLLEQVSSIFGVEPEDDDETSLRVGKDGPVVISRIEARIHTLAMNEDIFLHDPVDTETYDAWMAKFDLETKNSEMTNWLTDNPHLQLHYSQLVPDKVSHLLFWHRFYFQVYLITLEEEAMAVQDALETRRNLKRDAEAAKRDSESPDSQEGGNDIVHISEEDQKRLLTEYEEEMKRVGPSGSGSAHSRRSSEQEQLSSSSSGSFAFVTHDAVTNETKLE